MMMVREQTWLTALLLLLLMPLACAIPVLPTGGPVDEQPVTIVEADPAPESVNVETDRVVILFSEYVDQASFLQSLTITPEFDQPPQIRWKKKEVEVTFPESLRENTTYILTLDTGLRDNNRVALKEPITIAFATGPTINRGRIQGKVAQSLDGSGVANLDIYAYALADSTRLDSLPEKPAYRTQSGPDGTFKFDFMSEQSYFVVGLQDNNRNRKPDPNERYAVPPSYFILADSSASPVESPWLVTSLDTVPPVVQRVRSISKSRLGIRLNESIQLLSRSTEEWVLQDSATAQGIPILDLYLYPEDPKQVYLITDSLSDQTYRLIAANLSDSSSNPIVRDSIYFTPSQNSDTLQTRFLGFFPDRNTRTPEGAMMLNPEQQPGIRFNQPLSQSQFDEFLTAQDTTQAGYTFTASSADGSSFSFQLDNTFPLSSPLELILQGALVNAPDTSFTESFAYATEENLGELSGVIRDSTQRAIIELYPEAARTEQPEPLVGRPDSAGFFIFSGLLDKSRYRLRAFQDIDTSNTWSGGQIMPYIPAEPVIWYTDSLQVRARWEQSLPDTLEIP